MIERTDVGTVAVLRMAHGPVNALDTALLRALTETFRCLDAAAVVLTGSGRAFSAGVDLRRLLDGGPDHVAEFLAALSDALYAVFTFDRPVVAAVNGHAIAGGCVLACCADLRLMADGRGRIGVPEIRVGVPFPRVPLEIMVHAVGPAVANRLVTRAGTVSPAEAVSLGLVDELVAAEALEDRAIEAATDLATAIPADTFAHTKTQLRRPAVERMELRVDEDNQVAALWRKRIEDGWIAGYLAAVTGKG